MIKVLIVDDSPLARKLLGGIFASESDVVVEFARSGAEALEKASAFDPHVVTLDVNMPDMDGLACLDRLMLQKPRPVVMVSSMTAAGADATLEAMELGAVDVVAKPSGAVSLGIHEVAEELVRKVRSAATARVSISRRLAERIRAKSGRQRLQHVDVQARPVGSGRSKSVKRATGAGLVVIGVSTGGPPVLEKVLGSLNPGFGWPVVIAQHMPAAFTGALARRLNGLCSLDVMEVGRVTRLEPGGVYVARGEADMVISKRPAGLVAMPAPSDPQALWRPSVDRLMRTAMQYVEAPQLVGVMLTGMGYDGAKAMTELRAAGGRTIAEAEDSAVVWGMPGELVKAGGADWVADASEIGDLLNRLVPSCP